MKRWMTWIVIFFAVVLVSGCVTTQFKDLHNRGARSYRHMIEHEAATSQEEEVTAKK